MNFNKSDLKVWYKQFKALFKDGVQAEPKPLCQNDQCFNLTRLSPFMFTVLDMLSQYIVDYQSWSMPYMQFANYLQYQFGADLQQRLNNTGHMVIVNLAPDFEYAIVSDAKGYLIFNRHHGPLRMKPKTFVQNAIKEYMYVQTPHPNDPIHSQIVTFKVKDLNNAINTYLYQYENLSEDEEVLLEGFAY